MIQQILVVEDDADIRHTICRSLYMDNFSVVDAAHAEQALHLLKAARQSRFSSIRLILSDTLMPGMSGYELLQKVRSLDGYKETPVILMPSSDAAAYAYEKQEEARIRQKKGIEDLPNETLLKPFSPTDLLELVRKYPVKELPVIRRGKATILVIEPDIHLCEGITEILELNDYAVIPVIGGKEALEKMRLIRPYPDVILCEASMPNMDGFAFVTALKQADSNIFQKTRIIFLVQRGQASVSRGFSIPITDWITKPFGAEDLLVAIESALKKT